MTRIQITIPNHDTGKQEEIELLKKLTDNMSGSQSYLASLFSQPLFEWAADMIKEDFSPNLFLNYQEAHDKIRDGAQALNEANRDRDDYKEVLVQEQQKLIAITNESNDRGAEIIQFQLGMNEMRSGMVDANLEINNQAIEIGKMKNEIRNLKARLFDYMETDGTGVIERATHDASEPELGDGVIKMSDEQLDKIRASDEPKYNYKYDDQS